MSEQKFIRVASYAGYKGEERPMAFHDGDQRRRVVGIHRRWVESDPLAGGPMIWNFEVKGDDGNEYLLQYDALKKEWRLLT